MLEIWKRLLMPVNQELEDRDKWLLGTRWLASLAKIRNFSSVRNKCVHKKVYVQTTWRDGGGERDHTHVHHKPYRHR